MKKTTDIDKKNILNLGLLLDCNARELPYFLLDRLIDFNRSAFWHEILPKSFMPPSDSSTIRQHLIEKGLIVFTDDEQISSLYPFSAVRTRHRIQLEDGRFFYALDAIASLGAAFELEQNLVVSSSCSQCNCEILVDMVDGKISSFSPPSGCVQIIEDKNWANIKDNKTRFFCSPAHLKQWQVNNIFTKKDHGYLLCIMDAGRLAKTLFKKPSS